MKKRSSVKVSPSILSADFSKLDREIRKLERAGADLLHVDVMDGHFVPNITIGPAVVKSIRKVTRLPLDVHLMIENPEDFIAPFIEAGSDMITVHIETVSQRLIRTLSRKLKKLGIKFGVSLNPDTPLRRIKGVLGSVDFILVMSVYPGFSGQKFIPTVVPKIKELRSIFKGDIAVDGGVTGEVAAMLIKAGATILASGSYVVGAKDARAAMERIRNAAE